MEKETIQGTELTQRFKELRRQLSAILEPEALVEASISRDLGGGLLTNIMAIIDLQEELITQAGY